VAAPIMVDPCSDPRDPKAAAKGVAQSRALAHWQLQESFLDVFSGPEELVSHDAADSAGPTCSEAASATTA
jgi:hypothetical protein